MTDKEKWLAFFAAYGLTPADMSMPEYRNSLVFYEGDGGVKGYMGFRAEVQFDEAGKFVSFGVWE